MYIERRRSPTFERRRDKPSLIDSVTTKCAKSRESNPNPNRAKPCLKNAKRDPLVVVLPHVRRSLHYLFSFSILLSPFFLPFLALFLIASFALLLFTLLLPSFFCLFIFYLLSLLFLSFSYLLSFFIVLLFYYFFSLLFFLFLSLFFITSLLFFFLLFFYLPFFYFSVLFLSLFFFLSLPHVTGGSPAGRWGSWQAGLPAYRYFWRGAQIVRLHHRDTSDTHTAEFPFHGSGSPARRVLCPPARIYPSVIW